VKVNGLFIFCFGCLRKSNENKFIIFEVG